MVHLTAIHTPSFANFKIWWGKEKNKFRCALDMSHHEQTTLMQDFYGVRLNSWNNLKEKETNTSADAVTLTSTGDVEQGRCWVADWWGTGDKCAAPTTTTNVHRQRDSEWHMGSLFVFRKERQLLLPPTTKEHMGSLFTGYFSLRASVMQQANEKNIITAQGDGIRELLTKKRDMEHNEEN